MYMYVHIYIYIYIYIYMHMYDAIPRELNVVLYMLFAC